MNELRSCRRGSFRRKGTPGAEPPAPCRLLLSPKEETLNFTCSASPQRPRKGVHAFIPSTSRHRRSSELARETADPSPQELTGEGSRAGKLNGVCIITGGQHAVGTEGQRGGWPGLSREAWGFTG